MDGIRVSEPIKSSYTSSSSHVLCYLYSRSLFLSLTHTHAQTCVGANVKRRGRDVRGGRRMLAVRAPATRNVEESDS